MQFQITFHGLPESAEPVPDPEDYGIKATTTRAGLRWVADFNDDDLVAFAKRFGPILVFAHEHGPYPELQIYDIHGD